jgi:chromosome partitioning protein
VYVSITSTIAKVREMRTIAIVNQKGGSCKTTTAVNLAATLAERGRRVALLDLDPQYSATTWYAVPNPGKGVLDLFAHPDEVRLEDLLHETGVPNVSIIPSSVWLVGAEKALAGEPGAETLLRHKLKEFPTSVFDYFLVDCPPNLTILSINALAAVREVLVPVEGHVMGLHGLAQLCRTVDVVCKRLNPEICITGILPCRVDQRTNHSLEVVEKLRAKFPDKIYKTVIRENVRLAECPSMGEPITFYAPECAGAQDYRQLAEEVIAQENKQSLTHEAANL